MKRFVFHSESTISDISAYREYFGDYLFKKVVEHNNILTHLEDCPIYTRDVYQKSMYNILTENINKVTNDATLIINAYTLDYLVSKDRFLLKNNAHLIIDGALLIAKYLKISNIDFVLRSNYKKEKSILSKALNEAEETYYINADFIINLYDETSYKVNAFSLENSQYAFDLETVTQFAYFAHIGKINFSRLGGNKDLKGTFIVSTTGDIGIANLYEFEMGTSFKDILRISGNIPRDYNIKCVFTNGFLNRPIELNTLLSLSLDYESFGKENLLLGNAGFCFIKEDRCMIRVVLKIVQYAKTLVYGECLPSSNGFNLCEYYLNRILLGNSDHKDYSNLINTINMIIIGTPNLYIRLLAKCILSTIDMFGYEFVYAIENKVTMYSFLS